MVDIREILYPTDFSPASRHALDHAITLAKWYGSRITALHVMHVPLLPQPPILGAAFADATPPIAPTEQSNERQLLEWLRPAQDAGVATAVAVDRGDAPRLILEHADSSHADLIVMGTHGLTGFDRLLLGSVAEKVLRKATCPVMTVAPSAETAAKVPYRRLLCPVDFSESSLAALRFAFSLAEEADARLTVLHALDWSVEEDQLPPFNMPDFQRAFEARTHQRLDQLVTDEARLWCKPSTRITFGKPYRQILDVAAEEGSDLIVMGILGRNPLDLTVFGSTTNQVVRRAPCPVLTLRQATAKSAVLLTGARRTLPHASGLPPLQTNE